MNLYFVAIYNTTYMQLKTTYRIWPLVFITLLCSTGAWSQHNNYVPVSPELYWEIARMDSLLFDAFNRQDMPAFQALFATDLEWFQDNGGLLDYQTVFTNFGTMFRQPDKLTRKLVQGSLEVYPVKGYGAIETGAHTFTHMENGKLIEGTFKFLMIWQKQNGGWKISRVVSYDH